MNETLINETLTLALSGMAGAALGAVFFGGLWWTVRKIGSSPQPALWVFGSLLLRMGVALTGFYVVAGSHWERMLLCLLGFVIARLVVTWLTGPSGPSEPSEPSKANQTPIAQEVRHAS